jgi:hypothetical protein
LPEERQPHIILQPQFFSNTEKYIYPKDVVIIKTPVPEQLRQEHGEQLRAQYKEITGRQKALYAIQKESGIVLDEGLTVEVESFEGLRDVFDEYKLVTLSRLLNTKVVGNKTYAAFFIPKGKLEQFGRKLDAYESFKKDRNGDACDNQRLIDSIQKMRLATVKSLWTDDATLFPESESEIFYWEVWIDTESEDWNIKQKRITAFREVALQQGISISKDYFEFRDRAVFITSATVQQLEKSFVLLDMVAELRKAKTLAEEFTSQSKPDQDDYIHDLLGRMHFIPAGKDTPYVCILDTGVTSGHPLLALSINMKDCFTINPAWGSADSANHGTGIAGIILYGNNLADKLEDSNQYETSCRLESSKIVNVRRSEEKENPEVYAAHTKQAVSKAEIANSERLRLFQMAVTTDDSRDRGRPSSWSAAMDAIVFGRDDEARSNPRLCVVSGGNFDPSSTNGSDYPAINKEETIHDPAQAWNVITVGACTGLDRLTGNDSKGDNKPVAKKGELSPYSTTSLSWDTGWPYKPDIVMEGGNTAADEFPGQVQADSLSLLTTSSDFTNGTPLTETHATSASSALASRLCARILAAYPKLRPETIRGLLIHSADWTCGLKQQMGISGRPGKTESAQILRYCGWGIPSFNQALYTIKNNCTMIIEDELTPYNKDGTYKDIKFYTLPVPRDILLSHGKEDIEMRVTLSYFIEPNPSSRGRSKYSYESHGLRFELKDVHEEPERFRGRMTAELQAPDSDYKKEEDGHWLLGIKSRCKGSLHSDVWLGSAANLATSNILAVWPTGGWWKTSKDMTNERARFSLLVTIKTKADIDLLTPIQKMVKEMSSVPGKTVVLLEKI